MAKSICSISVARLTKDSAKYREFLVGLAKAVEVFNGGTGGQQTADYANLPVDELPDMPRFQLSKDVRSRALEKSAKQLVDSVLVNLGESTEAPKFVLVQYSSF